MASFATSEAAARRTPIFYMRIPKSGSSFLNTLFLNKDICPLWDDHAEKLNATGVLTPDRALSAEGLAILKTGEYRSVIDQACPNGFYWVRSAGDFMGVALGGELWEDVKNNAHPVIMTRQPEQRLLSDYAYQLSKGLNMSLTRFVKVNEGCQVRLFTRITSDFTSDHCTAEMAPVTYDEVEVAKLRLREFTFVGTTDQWDLSMCLWNAMYKQACSSAQFVNLHPTETKTASTYDTSVLDGYTDSYDGAFYAEALKIFNERLIHYNVSETACKYACNANRPGL
jgi:hypothetical protein